MTASAPSNAQAHDDYTTADTLQMTEQELAAATVEVLRDKLPDPIWRICNLYKILDKKGRLVRFRPNEAQLQLLDEMWYKNIILKARQLGFCLAPNMRVLTADLRWIPIGEIKPGQEVVACDEHPPGGRGRARQMRTAVVEGVRKVRREAYKITLDDGREVICTDTHPWLTKKVGVDAKWRSISGKGNHVVGRIKVGTRIRWIAKPWGESSYEDGWFGGMLDGEGSISNGNTSAGVSVSQRKGAVWDRLCKYATDNGYSACIENDDGVRPTKYGTTPVPKLAFGRMDELFRLIGQTRPTRFIGYRFWEGREMPGKRNRDGVGWATVVSIEHLGTQTMVDMQTSTGTYIAEGFVSHNTTFIQIMLLDRALFTPQTRAGIIAHRLEDCERILRDKIKLGYEQLPQCLRDIVTVTTSNESEIVFSNGSSVRVSTSMRSATLQFLHISEFGKICAKNPAAAREIMTGTLPAVDAGNFVFIESTAEGAEGDFFRMVQEAQAKQQEGRPLHETDYKLHFFAWYGAREYRTDPRGIVISEKEHDYFDALEAQIGIQISMPQRAWYVAKRRELGDEAAMWQEYPSTPEEAFKVSMEGCYYSAQFAQARREGRILEHIPDVAAPVNTFWDLGNDDATAIWLHQQVGLEHRLIGYYEASGEDLDHFVEWLQKQGYIYGTHYLPHDAAHKRLSDNRNRSIEEMLQGLGLKNTYIVPRTPDKLVGIQQLRAAFPSLWFDETRCKEGLRHVELYRKEWDDKAGVWKSRPRHDEHSHGSDALRALGQMFEEIHRAGQQRRLQNGEQDGLASERKKRKRRGNWKTA